MMAAFNFFTTILVNLNEVQNEMKFIRGLNLHVLSCDGGWNAVEVLKFDIIEVVQLGGHVLELLCSCSP
ncbi:hypothetical protein BUALT_Bualt07G0132400 [Buddleja alternifolia]|uniref:Uncharacterized protein n=1 Tax=Buddleja alternifolia TaxID=168488 RepID=A0AAV6XAI4_9LAMI|nr:hypothetical protein BUALT_Bualt07G0132400 [Buddleja alternifolia]